MSLLTGERHIPIFKICDAIFITAVAHTEQIRKVHPIHRESLVQVFILQLLRRRLGSQSLLPSRALTVASINST